MRGLLPPLPHPWLVGYTKDGSKSAPLSDSTTWWPEEEASTVHYSPECELLHSPHSAWAASPHLPPGPGLSPDPWGHFPSSYESCLSHCCPPQSCLPKWKLTNISHSVPKSGSSLISHTLTHLTLRSTTTLPQEEASLFFLSQKVPVDPLRGASHLLCLGLPRLGPCQLL